MADQNRPEDDEDVTKGGIENVVNEVVSGEEVPGEHPTEAYQFRQRIVSSDRPQDVIGGEEQQASTSEEPPPLPPADKE
ncbi:MAG TPA: hypothetical protein VM674_01285 [Candidatus Acidoferrum sp.]|nr:hypothetical protein [Candidatus Acidoferrum sp.]